MKTKITACSTGDGWCKSFYLDTLLSSIKIKTEKELETVNPFQWKYIDTSKLKVSISKWEYHDEIQTIVSVATPSGFSFSFVGGRKYEVEYHDRYFDVNDGLLPSSDIRRETHVDGVQSVSDFSGKDLKGLSSEIINKVIEECGFVCGEKPECEFKKFLKI